MENPIVVGLIALVFLTLMEIVLGIDNIVFIAIITGRLPKDQQPGARRLGLAMALVTRILLLLSLSWVLGLTAPLFEWASLGIFSEWLADEENHHFNQVSGRDIILLVGGLFLIGKSVFEIHAQVQGDDEHGTSQKTVSFGAVIAQIAVLDIIFSLDSVITAVGMVKAEGDSYWFGIGIMVTAIILAMGVMLVSAEPVSRFVKQYPTLKMLALSFLLLIGVLLVAEGIGTELNKGYIYFAMFFALAVEVLNLFVHSRKAKPTAEA